MNNRIINFLRDNKFFLAVNNLKHRSIVKKLKSKNSINLLFLTNHISQWKYQTLLEKFLKNNRYNCSVVFLPDENYNNNYVESYNFNKDEFKKKNIDLISSFNLTEKRWINLDKIYKPDIVFFSRSLIKRKSKYSIFSFNNSLTCYVPYSLFIDNNDKLQCATLFHKLLWKQFLPYQDNFEIAKKYYKGNNILITDYLGCDPFKIKKYDPIIWKNKKFKKIIWAPHHTIDNNNKNYFSTFFKFHKLIIELANKYKDSIDFCFKPHPALKQKLYDHVDWGVNKTNDYYNYWSNTHNTLLSENDYHNLFIESDGLILDSVSFTAEYLYLNKPYCFLTKDDFDYANSLNSIGNKIFSIIDKAHNFESLDDFIKNSIFTQNINQINKQKILLSSLNKNNNGNFLASDNIFNFIDKEIS